VILKKTTRARPRVRTILTLAGITLAVAAVPASASAAVRTGSGHDPQGDVKAIDGSPLPDLESIAVRYDDAGTLDIMWRFYNDARIGNDLGAGVEISDAPIVGGQLYDSAMVRLSGSKASDGAWSVQTTLSLTNTAGSLSGTGVISDDGRVLTAEFRNAILAGHDWRQVRIGGVGYDSYDQFWFDGFSDPTPPPGPVGPAGPVTPGPTPPGGGGAANGDQGMTINGGALYTNDPDVTLSIIAPNWAKTLRVANDGGFRAAKTFKAENTIRWRLAESGPERLPKTVYLRFGNDAQNFTDDIILDQTAPTVSSATLTPSSSAATSTAAASQARSYVVRLRARDQTSGVAKLQFANNRRRPGALRTFARNSRYQGASAPKYVRVRDRAGNFSRWRSIR
jgi:hypothetical protein